MIKVLYDLDESIDFSRLGAEIQELGLMKSKDPDRIYAEILKIADRRAGKPTENILKAYGSSKKELMQAIKDALEIFVAIENKDGDTVRRLGDKYSAEKLGRPGKLNDSKVLDLATELLDTLTDQELTKVLEILARDEKDNSVFKNNPYNILQPRAKALFRISNQEEQRFIDSKGDRLRGMTDKQATKRKIKKSVSDTASKVSGAIGKAAGAVSGAFKKLKRKGSYLAGWLS